MSMKTLKKIFTGVATIHCDCLRLASCDTIKIVSDRITRNREQKLCCPAFVIYVILFSLGGGGVKISNSNMDKFDVNYSFQIYNLMFTRFCT